MTSIDDRNAFLVLLWSLIRIGSFQETVIFGVEYDKKRWA